jgi:uncharacterized protein (TIGR04255 family)
VTRYRNAPLKYVIFAADLSPASILGETATLDRVFDALRDILPVREDTNIGTEFPLMAPQGGSRFVDKEQHRAVAIGPTRLVVDTTAYTSFTEFSGFLERVLDAVSSVAAGRACRRLGLRYVDEIRIPQKMSGDVVEWTDWMDPALFPPFVLSPARKKPLNFAGVVNDAKDEGGFGVRFAWHTGEGYAVQPDGPLRVPNPSAPGPYLALDTDSYWSSEPGTEVLGLGDPLLLERISLLHEPVQEYFESHLTHRIRHDVFQPVTEAK